MSLMIPSAVEATVSVPEKRTEVESMEPVLRRFSNRLRRTLSFMASPFRNLHGMYPSDLQGTGQGLTSQRMCPFCGLITPRYKRCCLECSKSLKPA